MLVRPDHCPEREERVWRVHVQDLWMRLATNFYADFSHGATIFATGLI